jgi:hypothetical protein
MRRLLAVAVIVVLAALMPRHAFAEAPFCQANQTPRFTGGFQLLKDALGDEMGEPIECDHAVGDTGDVHQQTTTGLSYWRKQTNTPTFTNGVDHWALTDRGLVRWTGESVDPPGLAVATPTAAVRAQPIPTPVPAPTAVSEPADDAAPAAQPLRLPLPGGGLSALPLPASVTEWLTNLSASLGDWARLAGLALVVVIVVLALGFSGLLFRAGVRSGSVGWVLGPLVAWLAMYAAIYFLLPRESFLWSLLGLVPIGLGIFGLMFGASRDHADSFPF